MFRQAVVPLLPLTLAATALSATWASATPITVSDPNGYLIVSNRANNSLGRSTGLRLVFGDTSVLPNGTAGTTATASTVNTTTGQTQNFNLPFVGSPALQNEFGNTTAYNAALTGPWTLNFANGTDTKVVTTQSATGATAPPFAQSVTFSGQPTNPTFTWSYPAGSVQGVFFDVFDPSIKNAAGTAALVYTHTVLGTTNSYTVQTQLAGGLTLLDGHQYTLDLYGVTTRDGTQNLSNRNSSGWSEAFFNFTPLPTGSPVVNLPSINPDGSYQYHLQVLAGQTYFLDPTVTTGYDFATASGNPNFNSVILPAIQSSSFDVSFLQGGSTVTDLVAPGSLLVFPTGGVSAFHVTGIDPSLGISPTDTTAFVTGVTFVTDGSFDGTQNPLTADLTPGTPGSSVPEPASAGLLAGGLIGLARIRRKRLG